MTLLLVVVLIVSVGFALWPILTRQNVQLATSHTDTPLGRLALRKEILLTNLADLDFEFAMGKLAQEDYESLRESLKRQAALVLEQMDVLRQGTGQASIQADGGRASAEAPTGSRVSFCTDCGSRLPGGAKFCPACGEKVKAV